MTLSVIAALIAAAAVVARRAAITCETGPCSGF
jgi:hypothetical protein